ncbi:MAG: response regulator [Rhodothermaceae bacterium]
MKKILVVDDQPDNVFILRDRLEHYGFEVLTAYDGPTGIEKAFNEQPDLILLDVMMPEMSGFEVCKELSKKDETKMIPVILVTALTGVEDLREGLDAGAFDYIKKPFNRVELIARINSALRFSEAQKMNMEFEKVKIYSATIVTANHEIKQPLTLINLSTAALRRELGKEELNKQALEKRVGFIETASKEIITVLEKLTSIRRPKVTEYINNTQMIDLNEADDIPLEDEELKD